MVKNTDEVIKEWPDDSKNVAKDIIGKYGDPDETTESMLVWYGNGPWKKTIVTKEETHHKFPMPHNDIVEQYISYDVPEEKFGDLAEFDGSVTIKRTEGLMAARCHDEPANFLALNLAHDIITDKLDVEEARQEYVQNMIEFRKGKDTPYMNDLQFSAMKDANDPDESLIAKEELEKIKQG